MGVDETDLSYYFMNMCMSGMYIFRNLEYQYSVISPHLHDQNTLFKNSFWPKCLINLVLIYIYSFRSVYVFITGEMKLWMFLHPPFVFSVCTVNILDHSVFIFISSCWCTSAWMWSAFWCIVFVTCNGNKVESNLICGNTVFTNTSPKLSYECMMMDFTGTIRTCFFGWILLKWQDNGGKSSDDI